MRTALRAIIYIRQLEDYEHCQAWCQARRHEVIGMVHDPEGTRYHEVLDGAFAGQCEVVVIRRLSDLPPDRVPRTEVADTPIETVDPRPRRRRPRPM